MLGTMSVRRALGVLSVKPGVCTVQVRRNTQNMKDETYWLKQKEKHLANAEKARREEVKEKKKVERLKEQHAALVLKEEEAAKRNASLLKEKERAAFKARLLKAERNSRTLQLDRSRSAAKERRQPKMAALRKRVAGRRAEKAAALQVRKTEKALLASSGPFTAHTLFIQKMLKGTKGQISAHRIKDVYAQWKALSAQQREVFEAEAAENRAKRAAIRESMKSLKGFKTAKKHFAAEYAAAKEQGLLKGSEVKETIAVMSRLMAQKYQEMKGEGAAKGHEKMNPRSASREEVKEDAVANAVETVKEALLKLEKKQVHNVKDETYWLKQTEKHLLNMEKARREEVSAKE